MIANSGHDEHGRYTGGKAGDQTGNEWEIRTWYSRPWNVILRHPNAAVRNLIATNAEKAAQNNHIGYDQYNRVSFYNALKLAGWDPAKITTDVESDCSAGATACAIAAGWVLGDKALAGVSPSTYSGNIRANLTKVGFTALTDAKYLTSDKYLLRGDILVLEGSHVAVNLTDGAATKPTVPSTVTPGKTGDTLNRTTQWKGVVSNCTACNIRMWAGTEYAKLTKRGALKAGETVSVCDTVKAKDGGDWYYVLTSDGAHGFVSAKYIKKADSWTGVISNCTACNIRTGAGVENATLKGRGALHKGDRVEVQGSAKAKDGGTWYKVKTTDNFIGFVSGKYITRV